MSKSKEKGSYKKFYSKPVGLDLYSLVRLAEVATYICYLFLF